MEVFAALEYLNGLYGEDLTMINREAISLYLARKVKEDDRPAMLRVIRAIHALVDFAENFPPTDPPTVAVRKEALEVVRLHIEKLNLCPVCGRKNSFPQHRH